MLYQAHSKDNWSKKQWVGGWEGWGRVRLRLHGPADLDSVSVVRYTSSGGGC